MREGPGPGAWTHRTFSILPVTSEIEGEDCRGRAGGAIGFIPFDHDDQRWSRSGIGRQLVADFCPRKKISCCAFPFVCRQNYVGRRPLEDDRSENIWYPRRGEKKVVDLPASMTFDPGLIFSQEVTNAISARYKICVRCGSAMVQSSGVGRKTCMKPRPWLEATFEP